MRKPTTQRGRPRQVTIDPEELRQYLIIQPVHVVARHYGVAQLTIRRRCAEHGIPVRPVGRAYGSGQVEAAILKAIAPGQWYSGPTLRPHVPGTRQGFYQILARLCAQGVLERRGSFQAYEWRRREKGSHLLGHCGQWHAMRTLPCTVPCCGQMVGLEGKNGAE